MTLTINYRGPIHLGLCTTEWLITFSGIIALAGTHSCRHCVRLLGCRVGNETQVHSLPAVTGCTVLIQLRR